MKTHWPLFIMALLFSQKLIANNIQVSNVRLVNQNTSDDFTMVEFDINWENSWRYDSGPGNWDAAWIFVKYKVGSNGTWHHTSLNNTGHLPGSNAVITNGFLNPVLPFNNMTNPTIGVFLYRSTAGFGNLTCQDVQLRWNYGSNGVNDNAVIDIRVFAIEMVYIPQGSFYVGSGGTESGAFYKYPTTTIPYYITSEAAITVGTSTDNLYYQNTSGQSGDQSGPVPAAFPKGFKAFYVMKHEISQQGYVDFLNALTRTQQIARVGADITGISVTNKYVMSNSSVPQWRSYIKCKTTIPPQPYPVVFMVDQNDNNIGGETTDGQNVACGFLSFGDLVAYLDWSGLRPMTEFEFEKCGRGNEIPSPNEFAWGNVVYNEHTGVDNLHTAIEIPTSTESNVASAANGGPLRIGIFARSQSDRTYSGAGHYGCLDLSSNLWELGINIGSPAGRAYTGFHGDGKLTTNGNHDVVAWPDPASGLGVAFRGGSNQSGIEYALLSGRTHAAHFNPFRNNSFGGRGVRTIE